MIVCVWIKYFLVLYLQVVVPAIMSLHKIYPKRNLPADQMRATGMLSLLAEPLKIMNVPNTDMVLVNALY